MERLQSVRAYMPPHQPTAPARRIRRRHRAMCDGAVILTLLMLIAATAGCERSGRYPSERAASLAAGRMPARQGERSVQDVLDALEPAATRKLRQAGREHGIDWPPKRLTLLAFKQERSLEVWGANAEGAFARLGRYRILAASGRGGPKRRQGDKQVPEGFYRLPELNPNSAYHLSIRVDYPNTEDSLNAAIPFEKMGGDIYIHGSDVSIGCLAIGDDAIEELFCLAAQVPASGRRIIIAPLDFRRRPKAPLPPGEPWVLDLYRRIIRELRAFPPPLR